MSRDYGEIMEPIKQQFRIHYKKEEELRYTANLDIHLIWERFFRRAGIPLAYTKGFHPQPRINQALPLPLGMLSDCELIDFWTESAESISFDSIQDKIVQTFQPGINIVTITELIGKQKSLQSQVCSVKYSAQQFYTDGNESPPKEVHDILGEKSILRTRRNKEYNLRPLIIELEKNQTGEGLLYSMHLLAKPGQSGRPDEVLSALGHDPNHFRITRTEILLQE